LFTLFCRIKALWPLTRLQGIPQERIASAFRLRKIKIDVGMELRVTRFKKLKSFQGDILAIILFGMARQSRHGSGLSN